MASTDTISKADDFRKQADKKLKGFGFFGNKYEEAADLLEKAANNYKLAKCWNDASECYVKLAECHLKCDSKHEAATQYVEAYKVAAKTQPQEAIALLQKAVALYTDLGRLATAARQLKEIAEVNEKSGLKKDAILFYEQAADLYETEGSTSEASKCKLKIAEFSAEFGNYVKALGLFEEAAKRAVENNLLKFSARGYLLNAGICGLNYLSNKDMAAKVENYRDIDLQFQGSREDMLLQGLCAAFEAGDDAMFSTHVAEFDSVIRLDAWKTKLLVAAKRRLQDMQLGVGGADEEEEEDELR